MTPRPPDHAAARRRIAFLRAKIVDKRADIAQLTEELRFERATLAESEAMEAGRKAPRSGGATKPKTRPRPSQAPRRPRKETTHDRSHG